MPGGWLALLDNESFVKRRDFLELATLGTLGSMATRTLGSRLRASWTRIRTWQKP